MTNANTETPANPTYEGWAHLTDRVLARISGPGTDKFVQGQFSQSVDEVTAGQSLRAAACTPKGRAYCITRLVRDGEDLLLSLERETVDDTLQHLNKYLMLFRGTSLGVLDSGRITGLLGIETARQVAGAATDELTRPGQVLSTDNGYLIRVEDDSNHLARFELWQTNAQPALPPTSELPMPTWQASEISAGVPWLTAATREAYVPQMLNLQHLQGIHFKKGCYTGQEVIARMHFLGQLKKSLFRVAFSGTDVAPAAGTRLIADDSAVGEVVNSVLTGEQQGEMLAVIRHDAASKHLGVDGHEGLQLEVRPIPYPVPEREKAEQQDT
jgi:folate-binding protein YgfZ